jgi:DNA recombination protein RmuC
VGKHIEKSQEAWDTAHKRLSSGRGNLIRRTEELKKLGAKAKKSLPDNMLDADPLLPLVANKVVGEADSNKPENKE